MVEYSSCFIFAYLLGSLNPAALISIIKKKNLRELGTGNLGATNVGLALGKAYGFIVMVFDIAKAYIAAKLAKLLFPQIAFSGLVAGLGAVVGHSFPFYLRFRGGKGLAPFGGMMLAYSPFLSFLLLGIGIVMILISDYPIALTFSAVVLAPVAVWIFEANIVSAALVFSASALVFFKHLENIAKIREGREMTLSQYLHKSEAADM